MYTQTDEIMLHSQRAFDVCRDQVYDFEDCRQLDYNGAINPALCKEEGLSLMKCYQKVEEVEPICMQALNNYRECNFRYHGNLAVCNREMVEFNKCQEDPKWYLEEMWPRVQGLKHNYNASLFQPRY
jgi:hypothetical protein